MVYFFPENRMDCIIFRESRIILAKKVYDFYLLFENDPVLRYTHTTTIIGSYPYALYLLR